MWLINGLFQLNEVPYKRRRQVQVIQLSDMEKHYALIHASLQLAQKTTHRSSSSAHISSLMLSSSSSRRADELVGLLVDAGLFDVAINICQLFDLKMDHVFEHLTVR